MEVYLIRHTTPAVLKGFIYGRTDIPLADTFEEEIKAVLQQLPATVDAVYSSPSSRCCVLAQEIAANFITDERLYEVNFGRWEGRTWDEIDHEESKAWMEDYVNVCPPEGESMVQMRERVIGFWKEMQQQPFESAAIVTHGGVIRLLLAELNNIPLHQIFRLKVDFGQVIPV